MIIRPNQVETFYRIGPTASTGAGVQVCRRASQRETGSKPACMLPTQVGMYIPKYFDQSCRSSTGLTHSSQNVSRNHMGPGSGLAASWARDATEQAAGGLCISTNLRGDPFKRYLQVTRASGTQASRRGTIRPGAPPHNLKTLPFSASSETLIVVAAPLSPQCHITLYCYVCTCPGDGTAGGYMQYDLREAAMSVRSMQSGCTGGSITVIKAQGTGTRHQIDADRGGPQSVHSLSFPARTSHPACILDIAARTSSVSRLLDFLSSDRLSGAKNRI
jgi:hypothetical protein